MVKHISSTEQAKQSAENSNAWSVVFIACATLGLGMLAAGCKALVVFTKTSLTNRWYSPDFKEGNKVYYKQTGAMVKVKARWLFLLLGVGTKAGILAFLFYFKARRDRVHARTEQIFANVSAYHKLSTRQNQTMREGMVMSVAKLQASIQELSNMNPQRKMRKTWIIKDVGWKVFAMSMAVDEYIMWLSQRDYFPVNFSVRDALKPARYDKIKKVFDDVQQSQRASPTSTHRCSADGVSIKNGSRNVRAGQQLSLGLMDYSTAV